MGDIRSEQTDHIVRNPWDKRDQEIAGEQGRHFLSDAGGLASRRAMQREACHCGCLNPPGGFCGDCHQLICVSCFHRCVDCGKPLGPCCSTAVQTPDGEMIRLCRQCRRADGRKHILGKAARLLLAPVIRFRE